MNSGKFNSWHRAAMLTLALVILKCSAVRAEVTYTEVDDKDSTRIVHMTVTPAAEPVPALKYRLLAREIDLQSGNAAPYYYRTFHELTNVMRTLRKEFDEEEELSRWYAIGPEATPIANLPREKLHAAVLNPEGSVRAQLRDAMSRRDCDWQLDVEDDRGTDVIAFLLGEFQQGRELTRMLVLETRLAIAERRFDDAIDAMRMTFRLAIDTARVPFLVNGLIGIAEAGMANGTMLEFIAAPQSPNLYWAIAELPDPLVDLRKAARFEIEFGPRMFPFIHHAETTVRAPDEWNRLYTESFRDLATLGDGVFPAVNQTGAGLVAAATALTGYSRAKARLVSQGMDPAQIEAMAVGQVIAIYTERTYQRFADEYAKLWNMPYWEMRRQGDAVEKSIHSARMFGSDADREILPIVSLLMPAMLTARTAEVRLERDLAAIQAIEALRMYAASHAGGLPARLDEITEVPVPLNPATGQPFVYRLDGATALLELPASDGIPGISRRFEIKIVQPEVSADDVDERR